jgi:hypothetical protein
MFPYLIKVGMKGGGNTDVKGTGGGNRVQERGNRGGGGERKNPKQWKYRRNKEWKKSKKKKGVGERVKERGKEC